MTTAAPQRRECRYDEDLLVTLIARGNLSYRKIAAEVGLSRSMVQAIAHGRKRQDLHERIFQAVEDDHRRAGRLGSGSLCSIVAAHIRQGLEGTGEPARLAREAIMRIAFNTSDPAGRYLGRHTDRTGRSITDAEQDLLDAVRADPAAAPFDALPKPMRRRLQTFVAPPRSPQPVAGTR